MANAKHLKILRRGVDEWNEWRDSETWKQLKKQKKDCWDHDARKVAIVPKLAKAVFRKMNLQNINLQVADLQRAYFWGADLSGANLEEANLKDANLWGVNLKNADLQRANLNGVNLEGSNLSSADFSGATLEAANLRRTVFRQAVLNWVNFSGANLRFADLRGTEIHNANFEKSFLLGAEFKYAHVYYSSLKGTELNNADLTGAIFQESDFMGASLEEARLGNTIFSDVNLIQAKGLEFVEHTGPSVLDYRTLKRSGSLPDVFLRGCGLPDTLIQYIPSLLNASAIQFYSCFISHSSKDQGFADRLFNDLQGKGIRCWYAPEEMKGGEKVYEQIDAAIRVHDKLLLVLSENSMNSEWVKTELRRCMKAERKEQKRKLFPIGLVDYQAIIDWECFDADYGKDLAVEVREYFIPDFSSWKNHDSYQKALSRLLRDLKDEE